MSLNKSTTWNEHGVVPGYPMESQYVLERSLTLITRID